MGRKPVILQDALSTLRDMGMAGVVPSTDTFNTLMSACFSRGDPASVPYLFRRLISLGHSPDALSYTSLIAALTRIDRPKDAVSPFPDPFHIECHGRGLANQECASDPSPGLSTWIASSLHACMQVLAFEAMQADSRVAIDIAALNAVVDAYARCGRMPEAETCLHEATQRRQQRGIALNDPCNSLGLVFSVAPLATVELLLCKRTDASRPNGIWWHCMLETWVASQRMRRARWSMQACHRPWRPTERS